MAVTPLRVIFAGTPEVAVPALRAIDASDHHVVAVLSKPDAPAGRGKKVSPSAVSLAARGMDVPVHNPVTLRGIGSVLESYAADVVAVVAYGLLVPPEALALTRFGWVNAHFSQLPAWRGAAPVQHSIAAGDEFTGVTTFRIDAGLDTGPILMRSQPVQIGLREDSGALLQRLAPIGADLMVRTLDCLADCSLEAVPQSAEGVSVAPQITVDDARIRWQRHVDDVDRWIRACTPNPGAWTTVNGDRLRISTPVAVDADESAVPGRFQVDRRSVRIGAIDGYLVLGDVHPQGKKPMPASAWVRGLREELVDAV